MQRWSESLVPVMTIDKEALNKYRQLLKSILLKVLSWLGINFTLSLAEVALNSNKWQRANFLFFATWKKLASKRGKGKPQYLQEKRTLTGLIETNKNIPNPTKALEWCRTGQALGFEEQLFFEYPANLFLNSGQPLLENTLNDLISWACWSKNHDSAISTTTVISHLKPFLRPNNKANPTIQKSALENLDKSELPWSWVYLYLAEWEREKQNWEAAASSLEQAIALESNSQKRGRLLWMQTYCYAAITEDSPSRDTTEKEIIWANAYNSSAKAIALTPPKDANEWCLAIRVAIANKQPKKSLSLIVQGLELYPSNLDLVTYANLYQNKITLGLSQQPHLKLNLSTSLHNYALGNIVLVQQSLKQGLVKTAIDKLYIALGAWGALLQNKQALVKFGETRYHCYASNNSFSDPELLPTLIDNLVENIIQKFASQCQLETSRLSLIWQLEKQAAAFVNQLGEIPIDNELKVSGGPLLANALGWHNSVLELYEQQATQSRRNIALENILERLANNSLSPNFNAENLILLFSPLGLAKTLLENHKFHLVAEEVNRVINYLNNPGLIKNNPELIYAVLFSFIIE